MKIYSIQNYNYKAKTQNFTGNANSNIHELFAHPDIPKRIKRTLWDLSENSDFEQAATATSKSDLLRLAKMVNKAKTNILSLILQGKVKIATDTGNGLDIRPIIPLTSIARYNKTAPKEKQKSLYEIVKTSPIIDTIEDTAIEIYPKNNFFPRTILYQNTHSPILDQKQGEDAYNSLLEQLLTGKITKNGDVILLFDKPIKGKNEIIPHYSPTPRELVGKPSFAVSDKISTIFQFQINNELKKALFDISGAEYFSELTQKTSARNLIELAKIDHDNDNLLVKMLNKDAQLSIYNPATEKYVKKPIIDAERILLDKKFGLIKEDDFYDILDKNTIALEISKIYGDFKKVVEEPEITGIAFDSQDGKLLQVVNTRSSDSTETYTRWLTRENPEAAKILDYLDKIPYKQFFIEL